MNILDFDGCSEILVKTFEDGEAFFKSDEYKEKMNSESVSHSSLLTLLSPVRKAVHLNSFSND